MFVKICFFRGKSVHQVGLLNSNPVHFTSYYEVILSEEKSWIRSFISLSKWPELRESCSDRGRVWTSTPEQVKELLPRPAFLSESSHIKGSQREKKPQQHFLVGPYRVLTWPETKETALYSVANTSTARTDWPGICTVQDVPTECVFLSVYKQI